MGTRGMVWILLAGTLVLVLATGAALAAQTKDDRSEDKSGDAKAKDGGDNRNGGGQALEFQGRPTSVNGYVDLGQPGASQGDLFLFIDELHRTADGQSSSEKVGQADGRCTLIDPSSQRFMCTVVASFENGTIVTEGIMTNNQRSPSASSVTGGTGEYRGVTGEATLDLAPPEGPHQIRFDLQRASSRSGQQEETGQKEETTQGDGEKTDEAKSTEKTKSKTEDKENTDAQGADKTTGKTRDR